MLSGIYEGNDKELKELFENTDCLIYDATWAKNKEGYFIMLFCKVL